MASVLNCKTLRQLTILILIAMIFSAPASAQDCTPDDITLSSQAEVDSFQVNHGPCDTLTGDLYISGNDIVDLLPLSALTTAGGDIFGGGIFIYNNSALTSLNGLSALTSVSGFLEIFNNSALTSFNGLSALTSVHYFSISNNATLANLDGLSALTTVNGWLNIEYNTALTNLNGLSALTSVVNLKIWNNTTLTDLNGLSGLTTVPGTLNIGYNTALTNLDGLLALTSAWSLSITYNAALTNLNGLSAVTNSWRIEILHNAALTNLDGLSALTSLDYLLSIWDNPTLTNLDGLSALKKAKYVTVTNNVSLDDCLGIVMLVDPIDDYEPGPGPGASGIPDVADQVTILNNLEGCNSVLEVLGKAPLLEINSGLNDVWFNPDTSGQGFFIIVSPEIKQIFLAWFTYDTERPPEDVTAILGEPGHRWLTAQGGYDENVALLDISVTAGGVFDSAQPAPFTEQDGQITVEFTTCNSGTVTYDIPSIDRQGEVPIERIVLDNVSTCYMLAKQAEAVLEGL